MGIWIMHTNEGQFYPVVPPGFTTPEEHAAKNENVFCITDELGRTLWMREPVKHTFH